MVKTSFETLHEDLQMQILSRLPLKSLMRCMCVSNKWASLIRSKEFRDLYLSLSMTRPRVLFVVNRREFHTARPEAYFHSVYQEEEPLLSSGQQQMGTYEAPLKKVSQPIRGLICHEGNNQIVICNPGSKKFLTLPKIQAPRGASMKSFFGYDEATNVFKVLCRTRFRDRKRSKVTKEYQVFTVGSNEESWRRITCKHDHFPVTEGLFKGRVLYYGARSNGDKSLVMSFNVTSEDFNVIELPENVEIDHHWKLVNYNETIALVDNFDYVIENEENGNGVFEMWVRDESAGNWWRNSIEIPRWTDTVDDKQLYFKGTIGTRELVFAPDSGIQCGGPLFVLYYDTVTTNLRRFEIKGMVDRFQKVRTFLDHVDSTWLM